MLILLRSGASNSDLLSYVCISMSLVLIYLVGVPLLLTLAMAQAADEAYFERPRHQQVSK